MNGTHYYYATVLRRTPYEPSSAAKFPLIKHEFLGKLINIFLSIFHVILFEIFSEAPVSFKEKYS